MKNIIMSFLMICFIFLGVTAVSASSDSVEEFEATNEAELYNILDEIIAEKDTDFSSVDMLANAYDKSGMFKISQNKIDTIADPYDEQAESYIGKLRAFLVINEELIMSLDDEKTANIVQTIANEELSVSGGWEKGITEVDPDLLSTQVLSKQEQVSSFNTTLAINTTSTVIADQSWNSRRGNFLVTLSSSSYGFEHGHAAMINGKTDGFVIEASTTLSNGAKAFNWSYANLWPNGRSFKDVVEYYIQGMSWSQYDAAVNYAYDQRGEPYGLKAAFDSLGTWYCSKLVHWAYKHPTQGANYDYGGRPIPMVGIKHYIWPSGLISSFNPEIGGTPTPTKARVYMNIGGKSIYNYK